MVHLPNGNWLASFTTYPGAPNHNYISIYRSADNCRTWTALSIVSESPRDLDNAHMTQLANGTTLLTFRSTTGNDGSGFATDYRLPVYKSTDGGAHWSKLSIIDSYVNPSGSHLGLWEPDVLQLDDGRVVASYSNETHAGYSQIISQRLSSDNGATWGTEIWAVNQIGGGNSRPGMPILTRMADGNYIMVFEVAGTPTCGSDACFKISYDGFTWPGGLGLQLPYQETGPFVLALTDGRLLVSSGSNRLIVSSDYGANWTEISAPWSCNVTFPGLYETKPGEIAWIEGNLCPPAGNNNVAVSFGSLSAVANNEAPLDVIIKPSGGTALYTVGTDGNVWTLYQTTSGGSWSAWTSLGGSELSGLWHVHALMQTDGTQVLFAQAKPGGTIYLKQQMSSGGDGSWQSTWTSLGGSTTAFDAQLYPDGSIALYGLSRGVLWTTWQNSRNGPWNPWTSMGEGGGVELTRVHMLTETDGTSIAFCLDLQGHIWTTWQLTWGGSWSGWADMGNTFEAFEPVLYPNGNTGLFGLSGNQVWTRWQDIRGGAWSSWVNMGGGGLHNLHAAQEPNGASALFDMGWPNNNVWTTWQTEEGGAWSNPAGINLGGIISDFKPIVYPDGHIALFGISNGAAWETTQSSEFGSWSGWFSLGGGPFFPQ